jgi:phospholipase/carboxylesterase
VLLHGHGDQPERLLGLAHVIDPERRWSWFVPTGPTRTDGGGAAWFPSAPGDDGPPLAEALDALDAAVDRTSLGLGTDPTRSAVLGYSQGAAAALALVCRAGAPWRPGAAAGVAAWLADEPELAWDLTAAADAGTAFRLVHGTDDPVVPVQLGRGAARALERHGAAVTWVERDGGHELDRPALAATGVWLAQRHDGDRTG